MKKILIVEDEPLMANIFRDILIEEGYDVKTACNSNESEGILTSFSPDLVLLDYNLGENSKNGIELIPIFKKRATNVKIVMISSYGDGETIERSLEMGADDYWNKFQIDLSLAVRVKRIFNN